MGIKLTDTEVEFICTYSIYHGLRTPREEIAFTARPKIQSQIFRYGGSIFCLPHRPNFSDIFDLCLHWVSVVRGIYYIHFSSIGTTLITERETSDPLEIEWITCFFFSNKCSSY